MVFVSGKLFRSIARTSSILPATFEAKGNAWLLQGREFGIGSSMEDGDMMSSSSSLPASFWKLCFKLVWFPDEDGI